MANTQTDILTAYLELCDASYGAWKHSLTEYAAKTTHWATFFK